MSTDLIRGDNRERVRAKGCRVPGKAGLKIAVMFDDDTFAQIGAIAHGRRVSFAKVVRELVEFGLLDLEEESHHAVR